MFRLIRTAHTSPPRHSASPGSTTLPLPSPMPVALYAVDHDELNPRPSVPFSHYKRRPPPLVLFTPVHSPPLTDHTHSLLEQGEHQMVGISPEFAAAEEERCRRLEPPQEKLPVPGEQPS